MSFSLRPAIHLQITPNTRTTISFIDTIVPTRTDINYAKIHNKWNGVHRDGREGSSDRIKEKESKTIKKKHTYQWRHVGVDMLGLELATTAIGTGGTSSLDKTRDGSHRNRHWARLRLGGGSLGKAGVEEKIKDKN